MIRVGEFSISDWWWWEKMGVVVLYESWNGCHAALMFTFRVYLTPYASYADEDVVSRWPCSQPLVVGNVVLVRLVLRMLATREASLG